MVVQDPKDRNLIYFPSIVTEFIPTPVGTMKWMRRLG